MDTWTVMNPRQLRNEEQAKKLSLLLFLKEKRCGKIKGRGCINGALQRVYVPQGKCGITNCFDRIDVYHLCNCCGWKRQLWWCNIPSAFVNRDAKESMLMVLRGELAENMVRIAPYIYSKHITVVRKGSHVFYVKLQKALYGLMRANLLFYWKLWKELEEYGFAVNPYNPCVANKDVGNGVQMTIKWRLDNLMASWTIDFELMKLTCYPEKIYGPMLAFCTGRKHDYLRVDRV